MAPFFTECRDVLLLLRTRAEGVGMVQEWEWARFAPGLVAELLATRLWHLLKGCEHRTEVRVEGKEDSGQGACGQAAWKWPVNTGDAFPKRVELFPHSLRLLTGTGSVWSQKAADIPALLF